MLRENKLSHGDAPTKLLEDPQPYGNRTGILDDSRIISRKVCKRDMRRFASYFISIFFSHDIGYHHRFGP